MDGRSSGRGVALLAACVVALGTGCGGGMDEAAAPPGTPPAVTASEQSETEAAAGTPPAATASEQSEEEGMGVDPALEGLVAQAVQDLAARAAVGPGEITVVSAEQTVWPDASLGCPQPGMRYTQVPEDGALIRLEVAGRVYPYHTGGSRVEPFLCEQTGKSSPPARTLEPRLGPTPER